MNSIINAIYINGIHKVLHCTGQKVYLQKMESKTVEFMNHSLYDRIPKTDHVTLEYVTDVLVGKEYEMPIDTFKMYQPFEFVKGQAFIYIEGAITKFELHDLYYYNNHVRLVRDALTALIEEMRSPTPNRQLKQKYIKVIKENIQEVCEDHYEYIEEDIKYHTAASSRRIAQIFAYYINEQPQQPQQRRINCEY